jgi:GTP:adenosylcobinamide-phosphate guanylyltransferase
MTCKLFQAIVLAGERAGGSPLGKALGLPASVLAPLAGQTCIQRVVTALRQSRSVSGGFLCGPSAAVVAAAPEISVLLAVGDYEWRAPAGGPAASAFAAAEASNKHPLLLTSADHGLLDAAIVDSFCQDAAATASDPHPPDIVIGLVPHERVSSAFPDSKRTVLRFHDGAFCGSNLYAVTSLAGHRALRFWSEVEAFRKRPWKIARALGPLTLLRYIAGRLTVAQAFRALSRQAGCRVGWVLVANPRAAVDVDTLADWQLACRLLEDDATGPRMETGPASSQAGSPAGNRAEP